MRVEVIEYEFLYVLLRRDRGQSLTFGMSLARVCMEFDLLSVQVIKFLRESNMFMNFQSLLLRFK